MKNQWLKDNQERIRLLCMKYMMTGNQQVTDFACIAFAEWYETKFNEDVPLNEAGEFFALLQETAMNYSQMLVNDAAPNSKGGNGDNDFNYTKEKLDRRLREIFGDSWPPFEERYPR